MKNWVRELDGGLRIWGEKFWCRNDFILCLGDGAMSGVSGTWSGMNGDMCCFCESG